MNRVILADAEWREELTSERFRVCREGGTEASFSGRFVDHKQEGIYVCGCCGNKLFDSAHKFDSGCGWPSFWDIIEPDAVRTRRDLSGDMVREEATCADCDAHLGHVFTDGPQPTGLRWCINSVCLEFVDRAEIELSQPA